MLTFQYIARDSHGKKIKGFIDAANEKEAVETLVARTLFVVQISKGQAGAALKQHGGASFFGSKISDDDLTMFFLQLSNMLKSGISILKSLDTIIQSSENRRLSEILDRIHARVSGGSALSESMKSERGVFPPLYTSIVEVGEASGNLGDVLGYIASLNESKTELKHEVNSAIAYPIVLLVATIAVSIFMVVWVLPSFMTIFQKSGVALPRPTQMLYDLSFFLKHQYFAIALTLVASFFCVRIALLNPLIRLASNDFSLKIPVVGTLIKKIEVARWSRSLGLMLKSGVPILKSLEVAVNLTGNLRFQKSYSHAIEVVKSGGKIAESLKESKIIPGDVLQMVAVGESSGSLDEMLIKIAEYYDLLVKRALKKLTAALEPFFIVLMGAVVGFVMLSVLMPIFDMIKAFHM